MTPVRRILAVVGLVGLVVVVAGCKVDTRVEITMGDGGSGVLRTTITVDADAVVQLGGRTALARNVPMGDLRAAGWTISPWSQGSNGSASITLSHPFVDERDLGRRVVDLAGPRGILQNPAVTRERGWFSSRDALGVVVDVRAPSIDIVHDAPLATRLRAAGVDPVQLQKQLAAQLRTALHLTVVVHLPDGHTETYDAATGSVKTFRVSHGGTDWDRIVRFGIGLMLAFLAGLFFLSAGVGARRNRRRAAQRITRASLPENGAERSAAAERAR